MKLQLKDKACVCYFYSIVYDESTYATNTALGVNDNFCCSEEQLDMMSLKDTTEGKNILKLYQRHLKTMGFKWERLYGVTMDGAPAMISRRLYNPSNLAM